MNGSKRLSMSTLDWRKVLTGLGVGIAGAVLAWLTTVLIPAMQETGDEKLLFLAVVLATIVNGLRKWIIDTRSTDSPPEL